MVKTDFLDDNIDLVLLSFNLLFYSPAIDPIGSLDMIVGVLNSPWLGDWVTKAASAAMEADEFPSGFRDSCDTTDNRSKDVLEIRGRPEGLAAEIVVAWKNRDWDGGNDATGVRGTIYTLSSWLSIDGGGGSSDSGSNKVSNRNGMII